MCQIFRKIGFKVISADEIGHNLLEDKSIIKKLVRIFGNRIITDGAIDRKKLGKSVFSDYKNLKKLNEVLHPEIRKKIKLSNSRH